MKHGLVFTKYDTKAATTRQRFVQAMPYLEAAGVTLELRPLFDNCYLEQFFSSGKRSFFAVAGAYWRRLRLLLRARDYDFIWVQYELFPYLPGLFERLVGLCGKPVIYDCDDAIFHQYDAHPRAVVRALLGKKIQPLLRRSCLAFCGNAYLAEYVRRFCPRVEIMPTVVDVAQYVPLPKPASPVPTLGWIGSPTTWRFCAPYVGMLAGLVRAGSMQMLVVGAGHAADVALPFTYRAWVEADEITDVQQMDIGMMPIPDAPWARGKCGYKLIQYMACGLPVIASPVGVNRTIVTHGINGFLASSEQEWRNAIAQLLADPDLRARMGAAGRETAAQHYSIQVHGPRMAALIGQLLA